MLRQALRGATAARPTTLRSITAATTAAIGYPTTARRAFAAAAGTGRGKGASSSGKEDKAASGGAAAAAKLNALTMAIKRIEHLHGKGELMMMGLTGG